LSGILAKVVNNFRELRESESVREQAAGSKFQRFSFPRFSISEMALEGSWSGENFC